MAAAVGAAGLASIDPAHARGDVVEMKEAVTPGTIIVRTHSVKVKIYLDNFTIDEREFVVLFFREAFAEELQENWIHAQFPSSRDIWRSMRRAALDAGATGIVLPNDPRLLDLVRNPDVEDDRADIKLAFG